MKPVGAVPDRAWLAAAVEALGQFDMPAGFPAGSWENELYLDVWKEDQIAAMRAGVGVFCNP